MSKETLDTLNKKISQFKVMLSSLFKRVKFFEIANEAGTSLLFDNSTIKIGDDVFIKEQNSDSVMPAPDGEYIIATPTIALAINVVNGKIAQMINKETGEQLDTYSFETQAQPQAQQAVQQKAVKQNETTAKQKSKFIEYIENVYLSQQENAEYPWDECIADMEDQGVDCPECVCAAIKNRTVAHNVAQGMSVQQAIQKVIDDVKQSETLRYILKKQIENSKPVETKQVAESKHIDELKNQIKTIEQKIIEQQNKLNDLSNAIIKQATVQHSATKKAVAFEDDLQAFRKKYYNA